MFRSGIRNGKGCRNYDGAKLPKQFSDVPSWIEGCDHDVSWIGDVDLESTMLIDVKLESTLLISDTTNQAGVPTWLANQRLSQFKVQHNHSESEN